MPRTTRSWLVRAALVIALGAVTLPATAQLPLLTDTRYVRIEEDWSLEILVPNGFGVDQPGSPQVVVQMGTGEDPAVFGLLQLNHREFPNFLKGGLQIQLWNGTTRVSESSFGEATLHFQQETVSWTQYMARNGVEMTFGVKSGQSQTWGAFNLDTDISRIRRPDSRAYFEQYRSVNSVKNSAINLGANRVGSLKLLRVRKYKADGTYDIEDAPQTAYARPTTTASTN
jgi:hypothetical protein